MKLKFWGTRGSIPTPGKDTVRYGGNTPCVEVRFGNDRLVILDAGTGIRRLGDSLIETGRPVKAFLLITHPHWDHIQGFPFFRPAFIAGNELTIIGGQTKDITLRQMIADQMNKIYFPILLSELKAKIEFQPIEEEERRIYDATLKSIFVYHPSFALGYRLEHEGRSLVYISDNEPFNYDVASSLGNVDEAIIETFSGYGGSPNTRISDFAQGADILIHDATYTPDEYADKVGWGHSPFSFTLGIAAEARVKKLILFHHDPAHTDDQIDAIVKTCRDEIAKKAYTFDCVAAAEGMELSW